MTSSLPLLWLECVWEPHTAFGSPVLGCTLFSRLVAELACRHGTAAMDAWLDGYVDGRPFVVIGDPRPRGHLPRPALAPHEFEEVAGADAKTLKARRWVHERALQEPASAWLAHAGRDADLLPPPVDGGDRGAVPLFSVDDRAGFSVGAQRQTEWPLFHYGPVPWVIDVLVDADRIAPDDVLATLRTMGAMGQGAHAARGLGKFSLGARQVKRWRTLPGDLAYCLGGCAPPPVSEPQGYGFARYRPRVIRGWAGPSASHERVHHAKLPMLLAEAGALFRTGANAGANFFGRGLGGRSEPLSRVDPRAVAQGYAPALWIARTAEVPTPAAGSAPP